MTSHLTKLTVLWPPFALTAAAGPARVIPSSIQSTAKPAANQPVTTRAKVKPL